MRGGAAALGLTLLLWPCLTLANGGAPPPRVVDLALADGGRQRLLVIAPPHPRAVLVMLPGGSGRIGIGADGRVRHGDNVLVRTRDTWAAAGYAVVIADTPDGLNLRGLRHGPAYAAVAARLVEAAHAATDAPVVLVGTSQGAIAAMNGAAHAPPGTVAALVLSESVSRLGSSHETVFDADPGAVTVPVLVVANDDDRCDVAPPADAARIAAALTAAPSVTVLHVAGGPAAPDRPCGSLSPHGYAGIETEVVGDVVAWLKTHVRSRHATG